MPPSRATRPGRGAGLRPRPRDPAHQPRPPCGVNGGPCTGVVFPLSGLQRAAKVLRHALARSRASRISGVGPPARAAVDCRGPAPRRRRANPPCAGKGSPPAGDLGEMNIRGAAPRTTDRCRTKPTHRTCSTRRTRSGCAFPGAGDPAVKLPEPERRRGGPHAAVRRQPRHRDAGVPGRCAREPVRGDARAVPGRGLPGTGQVRVPSVGAVEQGPPELRGRMVFCLYPHQTIYVVPAGAVTVVPDGMPPARRARRHRRNRRQRPLGCGSAGRRPRRVVGAGMVGCCVARLLARFLIGRSRSST